ncbi:MAG: LysR substrate-binding domain-containing protein [Rhizobiaceae bacterium]
MTTSPEAGLPPLEWLRAFEAAGRLGSFTAAAQETGLTQAAVSQRIKLLETRLGTKLFNRLPKGVELTVAGDAYLPHITGALARVRRGTADLFARPRRRLSIAATASIATLWVAPRLKRLAAALSGVELSVTSIGREADYDAGEHDYLIRFGHGDWEGHDSALLFREQLAPVAAPGLAGAAKSWRELPVIALTGPRTGWAEWASAAGEPPPSSPVLRFDSQITALEAARSGAGVTLASLPVAAAALEKGDLVQVSTKRLTMTGGQWLCWRRGGEEGREHVLVSEALAA